MIMKYLKQTASPFRRGSLLWSVTLSDGEESLISREGFTNYRDTCFTQNDMSM